MIHIFSSTTFSDFPDSIIWSNRLPIWVIIDQVDYLVTLKVSYFLSIKISKSKEETQYSDSFLKAVLESSGPYKQVVLNSIFLLIFIGEKCI